MITPYIIGQILGISFLVVSLSIIFNKKNTALVIEKITRDTPRIWMSGFISLLMGSTLLAFSNFSSTSAGMVAIIGILAFIKGIFLVGFPKTATRFYSNKVKSKLSIFIVGLVTLVFSIILILNSF